MIPTFPQHNCLNTVEFISVLLYQFVSSVIWYTVGYGWAPNGKLQIIVEVEKMKCLAFYIYVLNRLNEYLYSYCLQRMWYYHSENASIWLADSCWVKPAMPSLSPRTSILYRVLIIFTSGWVQIRKFVSNTNTNKSKSFQINTNTNKCLRNLIQINAK